MGIAIFLLEGKKECCTFVAKKTHSALLVLLSIRFKHIIGSVFFFRSSEKKFGEEKSESIFSLFRHKCNRPIFYVFCQPGVIFLWIKKSEMNFAWYLWLLLRHLHFKIKTKSFNCQIRNLRKSVKLSNKKCHWKLLKKNVGGHNAHSRVGLCPRPERTSPERTRRTRWTRYGRRKRRERGRSRWKVLSKQIWWRP